MSCQKRGYVSVDGKPAFDCEDREAARRNEKQKEILLVKYLCEKKKCSEGSNCKCGKSGIRCVLLCSCSDCGNVVLEAEEFNELRGDNSVPHQMRMKTKVMKASNYLNC